MGGRSKIRSSARIYCRTFLRIISTNKSTYASLYSGTGLFHVKMITFADMYLLFGLIMGMLYKLNGKISKLPIELEEI